MDIVPYNSENYFTLVRFAAAIQEHERASVVELKTGQNIGEQYATHVVNMVRENNGAILIAKDNGQEIGVICAWIREDDDMLLRNECRQHAYVSDIYVSESWRGKGIAQSLIRAIASLMRQCRCKRIRVCSKATNQESTALYNSENFKPYEVIYSKTLN